MGYDTKYVRVSKVKDLFVEEDKKIRISGDAKDLVHEYLDNAVAEAAKELINKLPRKSKGGHKGELKRITIQAEDFE